MKLIVFKLLTFSLVLSVVPMTANAWSFGKKEPTPQKEKETITVPADKLGWSCGGGNLDFKLDTGNYFAYLKIENLKPEEKMDDGNGPLTKIKCDAKTKELSALIEKNKGKSITMTLTKDGKGDYLVDKIEGEVADATVDIKDCKRSVGVDVVCPEGTYKYVGQQAANINSSAIAKPAASTGDVQATAVKNQAK